MTNDNQAETAAELRYPLYCVDRDEHGDDENRMYGPFTTHDDALARLPAGEPRATVRRCRQLRPSEIKLTAQAITEARDRWLNLRMCDVHDAIVTDVDDHACGGYLPAMTWSRVGEQIVFGTLDDGTLPTPESFAAWLDSHLEIEAYICEGDE